MPERAWIGRSPFLQMHLFCSLVWCFIFSKYTGGWSSYFLWILPPLVGYKDGYLQISTCLHCLRNMELYNKLLINWVNVTELLMLLHYLSIVSHIRYGIWTLMHRIIMGVDILTIILFMFLLNYHNLTILSASLCTFWGNF